mmetsp:Transcript_29052/g.65003  ORF Transcript_29052/g.65003 Transcript_29052/m.65003 type:complete len:84 (+) Transcript_29052:351-602(+)
MPYALLGGHGAREGREGLAEAFPAAARLAASKGCSMHGLVAAWARHKWPECLLICGARSPDHVRDIAASKRVRLTASELEALG